MLFIVSTILMTLALAQADKCPEVKMPECAKGDHSCFAGMDDNGCPIPEYCITTEYEGEKGAKCHGICPTPHCKADEVHCDNGMEKGCWMGDYCMPPDGKCYNAA